MSIINSLKPRKSSCYDEITSKILETCPSLISKPWSFIYNRSQCTGIFPDCLKIAVVKSLYKTGDKTSMTNYRPTSSLTIFSKLQESYAQ
jgi:hypothetical protein